MILLKVGGGKDINWDFIAQDLKTLKEDVIIVHGANAWMKDISQKFGLEETFITSPSGHMSRYTDYKVIEMLTMVYSGLVNKKIVACLQKHSVNAIGLSGADGKIWQGKRKDTILSVEKGKTKVVRDCLTGNVVSVNIKLLLSLLESNYVPVVTIPAITSDGKLINVDNDRAVAIMAKELRVKTVVMLFEAPGLLTDPADATTLVARVKKEAVKEVMGQTSGRMKKKMLGVLECFDSGVEKIYFGDGRIAHPVQNALAGKGTVIS